MTLRRFFLGPPIPSERAIHERLPKFLALPVFASDALSSVAYATQEILSTLLLAGIGLAAFGHVIPISLAIIALLVIVTISYRQTIHAYPSGGGAYIVARENLGLVAAQTAGASLLIDYILTVSVSVAAGVDAIISAAAHNPSLFHTLDHLRVWMCVFAVALIMVANLRGVKESGSIFALPTYSFIAITLTMVVMGLVRAFGGTLHPAETQRIITNSGAVGMFLLLKAFSSGCAALTGIEAISNGITAFKQPESKNAATTMTWMSAILGTMFLGISFLAMRLQIHYQVGSETVISQVGRAVFGTGAAYYFLQAATAGILILAANTSFADFPRLCALQAADGFLPRQLTNIGDRLVFSNGIIALAVISATVIAAFGGHTDYLIPLYAVGVFLSFTLSQAGMVRRWFRLRPPHWQISALVNGVGALVTGVVMAVIATSKWASGEHLHVGRLSIPTGAYLVVVLVPCLVYMFFLIHSHYETVRCQLTLEGYDRPEPRRNTVLVLMPAINRGSVPALQFAKSISEDVRAVLVEIDSNRTLQTQQKWAQWGEGVPLVVLKSPFRSLVDPILHYIDEVEDERDDDQIVVVIPEFVPHKLWEKLLHNHSGLMLKFALMHKQNVVVCNLRYFLEPFRGRVSLSDGGGANGTPAAGREGTPTETVSSGAGQEIHAIRRTSGSGSQPRVR
jgi:amino acid transporter